MTNRALNLQSTSCSHTPHCHCPITGLLQRTYWPRTFPSDSWYSYLTPSEQIILSTLPSEDCSTQKLLWQTNYATKKLMVAVFYSCQVSVRALKKNCLQSCKLWRRWWCRNFSNPVCECHRLIDSNAKLSKQYSLYRRLTNLGWSGLLPGRGRRKTEWRWWRWWWWWRWW